MTDELVGATTTDDTTTSVSEGSPSSIDSSSAEASTAPQTDAAAHAPVGFAEAMHADTNAGSEKPRKGGWIPQARHDEVLEKQRTERAAEKAAWETERAARSEKYGWAEKIDQAQLDHLVQLDEWRARDPVGYAMQLMQEIRSNPALSAQLQSLATREVGGRPRPPAEAQMPQPDVRHVDEKTGQSYSWYSADQLAKRDEWLIDRVMAQVDGRLQPLQDGVGTFQALHQHAQTEKVASEKAGEIFSTISALPGFSDHHEAIAKDVDAQFKALRGKIPAEAAGNPDIVQTVLHNLVMNAYTKIVVPQLTELGRRKAQTDSDLKARASTRNPKATGAAPPQSDKPVSFAAALAESMRGS